MDVETRGVPAGEALVKGGADGRIGGGDEAGKLPGLVEVADESVRPTELGRRFLNDLLGLFLPSRGT